MIITYTGVVLYTIINYYLSTTLGTQISVIICEYLRVSAHTEQKENPHEYSIFEHSCGLWLSCASRSRTFLGTRNIVKKYKITTFLLLFAVALVKLFHLFCGFLQFALSDMSIDLISGGDVRVSHDFFCLQDSHTGII